MSANITITGLPTVGSVQDTTYLPSETSTITQKMTALTLKGYMQTMANLTVTGNIVGNLSTTSQPYLTSLGNLTSLYSVGNITTSAQFVSNVATGTSPFSITSNTLVPNLYVARAAISDNAIGSLSASSTFANVAGADVGIGGNIGNITAILRTVNSTAGTWGGISGTTFYVPQIIINNKGLVTFASNTALNLTSAAVTSLTGTTNQVTVSGSAGAVTVSLPSAVTVTTLNTTTVNATTLAATGTVSGATVTDNTNRVITKISAVAGTGITITSNTATGPSATFTINNSGVRSLAAGTGVSLSATTGDITITNTGVTGIAGSSGISVSAATGGVTVSPTDSTYNSYGRRTISTGTPSGGADGDIWYQVQ